MGIDVVTIGLRHNLPINNPRAMAQELAARMQLTVKIVAKDEFRFNPATNFVSSVPGYNTIELGTYTVNGSDKFLGLYISDYQVNQILEQIGANNLDKLRFADNDTEDLFNDIRSNRRYDLYDPFNNGSSIDFYPECIVSDIFIGRWGYFEKLLLDKSSDKSKLRDIRMKVYEQAKLLGCNEVSYFPDFGPLECIFDNLFLSADKLRHYIKNRKFLYDISWDSPKEMAEWLKNGKQIQFSDCFRGNLSLGEEHFIEVVWDDFKDIISVNEASE